MAENETTAVKELANYPIDEMILSLARGIAKAQNEMDRQSLALLRERAGETLGNGRNPPSLLELGLFPAFFSFEETVLEVSLEISMHREEADSLSLGVNIEASTESNADGTSPGGGEDGQGAGKSRKSSVMFGASLNLEKSRKYGLDMSGATRITTTIRSDPPPKQLLKHFKVNVE